MIAEKIKIHPAAELFPPMTDAEFQELKSDIAKNGCRVPITFWNGQLIDGRNRLRACQELGIEPWTDELDIEHDPWTYSISHNLHRRHLTTSQRAMVASALANRKSGERTDLGQNCTRSIDDAAKSMNVSARSVKTANQVNEHGSETLKRAVQDGSLPVSTAAQLVKKVPDKAKQSEIVAKGPKKVREALKQTKLQLEVEPVAAASDEAKVEVSQPELQKPAIVEPCSTAPANLVREIRQIIRGKEIKPKQLAKLESHQRYSDRVNHTVLAFHCAKDRRKSLNALLDYLTKSEWDVVLSRLELLVK